MKPLMQFAFLLMGGVGVAALGFVADALQGIAREMKAANRERTRA